MLVLLQHFSVLYISLFTLVYNVFVTPTQATLTQIATMACPMKVIPDPSTANEILWNDPIYNNEHDEMIAVDQTIIHDDYLHPHGFPSNKRRGTANFFAEFAICRFLTANHLSHIIRAHECIPVRRSC